ncbi:MAG: replication factor C large subunit [DPANN group archaeon]|nr:replication factor C large subunit [DPANN group archaeon]
MWIHKYKLKTLEEFIGNESAVKSLINWADNWKNEKMKAVLIMGPTGSGKTTITKLIAKKLNYNIVETNASDVRSKKALETFFGQSLNQQSLFYKGKIVLFDEIDGISGQNDRGAPGVIKKIIETSSHPIILTGTDSGSSAVKAIKKICKIIKFEKVDTDIIQNLLKNICDLEKVYIEDKIIRAISRHADGDIRAAINDLETLAIKGTDINLDSVKGIGFRDSKRSIENILKILFITNDANIAIESMDNLGVDPGEMLEWVRENMPREYTDKKDIAKAYEFISRADIFKGRITRMQYYRFMVYEIQLMTAGVAASKSEKPRNLKSYHFPTKIAVMARTMFERAKNKTNAKALSPHIHTSTHVAREYFPLIKLMKEKNPEQYRRLSEEIGVNI